ncbi:MAG: ABC transporter ATP-binding protein [Deltaproteobacteria bacterium]|jgi:putative ABC transport system ATP-binding protein|nr:ABC transporter ATP-binding protein [Deltaproteobacteria bacterium]
MSKIEIKNLTKSYSRGSRSFEAVKNASLTVDSGEFVCLIGRSGGGKSTLLNLIAGLLNPDSGLVLINGQNIYDLGDDELTVFRNRTMGYATQGNSLLYSLSVLDNVRLPFFFDSCFGDGLDKALLLLDEVGASALKDSFPSQLSGGELRRVSLARALINNPSILLADEPTNDLDKKSAEEIASLLKRLNERTGLTVLAATHDVDLSHRAGRALEMDGGVLS